MDKFWSEKPTWAFGSGELKKTTLEILFSVRNTPTDIQVYSLITEDPIKTDKNLYQQWSLEFFWGYAEVLLGSLHTDQLFLCLGERTHHTAQEIGHWQGIG